MDSFPIWDLLRFLFRVSDIFFTGLKIWVPVLFLLFIFRVAIIRRHQSIIWGTNILFLISGVIFTLGFLLDNILSTLSEGSEKIDFIINLLSGPHWYQYVIPVINFAVLPHLLWSSKLRQTIYTSFGIVIIWILTYYVTYALTKAERSSLLGRAVMPKIDIAGSLWDFIYVVILSIAMAIFLQMRKKHIRRNQ